MKNNRWFGLLTAALVPFGGCAQAPVQQQTPYFSGSPAPGAPGAPVPSAAAAQAPAPASGDVPPEVAEVVRLAEAGTAEDVLVAYVQNSPSSFDLSADNILYLKDLGLPDAVMTAMLNHRGGPPPNTSQPQPPMPQLPPQQPAPAAEPVYVSNPPPEVNYFYNDLAPYGTWVQLDGVGWCWQPRAVVINRSWRPYCDSGHWVYSDCGWFWQSDYSWGWAPFHYGRWQMHERCGWVWTPDREWGPAWVTWRTGGDNCGWAPLPPHAYFDRGGYRYNGVHVAIGFDFGLRADHFTFVAVRDFNNRDLGHRRLPQTEVRNVYNRTTIINNYTVNNNTVINRGIPVERVSAATHTQIRQATVRETTADNRGRAGRPAGGADSAVVYRTQPRTSARPVNVVAQKVDDRHPVVQHTPITSVRTDNGSRSRSLGNAQNQNTSRNVQQKVAPATPNVSRLNTPTAADRTARDRGNSRTYQTPTTPPARTETPSAAERTARDRATVPPVTNPRTYQTPPATPDRPVPQQSSRDRAASPTVANPRVYQTPTTPTGRVPEARSQNPQVYYPKNSQPAPETRQAPRNEPRSSERAPDPRTRDRNDKNDRNDDSNSRGRKN